MTDAISSDPILTARAVNRSYALPRETPFGRRRTRHAVVDADLDVPRGETLAIIGESGSGKSTFIRVLLGLDAADSGSVTFDGRPVEARGRDDNRWLRRETGIVLQDPYASLDPRFSILRSIAEPLVALGLPGDHRARVAEVLDQVRLEPHRIDQYPHELSGGQRQRVAIARAIVHRPKLLVGDEPLSALDVTVRAQILDLFRELRNELSLSIVLVSHDIGLVQHLADGLVVMNDGHVVEAGSAEHVLGDPQHEYTRRLLASVPPIPSTRLLPGKARP